MPKQNKKFTKPINKKNPLAKKEEGEEKKPKKTKERRKGN